MTFAILGEIEAVETIAAGTGVKDPRTSQQDLRSRALAEAEGFAKVRLGDGALRCVKRQWYEAHGIGRRDVKMKAYVDQP